MSEPSKSIETKFDRIDELVSLLVDEVISDDQLKELESMLAVDQNLRARYINGIQLHCDLIDHYNPRQSGSTGEAPVSPVLTMLAEGDDSGIGLSIQPPKQ